MKATETKLKGCFLIEPQVFYDSRGYFFESFNTEKFERLTGQQGNFVQDNQSASVFGVIRGLHFQKGDSAQAKLVRAIEGAVLDVAVDIRPDSETYGQWVAYELSAENHLQLYVPRGFAHGFSVLTENAVFAYKCDNLYDKAAEGGILYSDPTLAIDWRIPAGAELISEKDEALLPFAQLA